jgi:hypothetical protein
MPQAIQQLATTLVKLDGNPNYTEVFQGLGVVPADYEASAHANIETKAVILDATGLENPATQLNLSVTELNTMGMHALKNSTSVVPYAVVIKESVLAKPVVDDTINAAALNMLRIQLDRLTSLSLVKIATQADTVDFNPMTFHVAIADLFRSQIVYFPGDTRKVLFIPHSLRLALSTTLLASDETKSMWHVLQALCNENNTFIETYRLKWEHLLLDGGMMSIILVQNEYLASFPGESPYKRGEPYTDAHNLHRNHQFFMAVGGFVPNAGSVEQNANVVTVLPVNVVEQAVVGRSMPVPPQSQSAPASTSLPVYEETTQEGDPEAKPKEKK